MKLIDPLQFNELVRLVYSAGLDRQNWARLLKSISDVVGNVSIAMHSHDVDQNANTGFLSYNYSDEHNLSYRSYYAANNPWNELVPLLPVGKVVRSEEMLDPNTLRRTEFYNDWIRPQDDIGSGAGITLFRDHSRFLRLSANLRFRDVEVMQEPLAQLLEQLGPHVVASFDLSRRLAGAYTASAFREVITLVKEPLFVLDHDGKVCFFNVPAEKLYRDGGYLKLARSGRLAFRTNEIQQTFSAALQAIMSRTMSATPTIILRSPSSPLMLRAKLSPLVPEHALAEAPLKAVVSDEPAAILILETVGQRGAEGLLKMVDWYGLTASELALAKHLFANGTVRTFAEQRQVSIHTARNQVRSLLAKTGNQKQTALFAMMGQIETDLDERLAKS